jgi:hypothetical protein
MYAVQRNLSELFPCTALITEQQLPNSDRDAGSIAESENDGRKRKNRQQEIDRPDDDATVKNSQSHQEQPNKESRRAYS